MRWFVSRNGETMGPVEDFELKAAAQKGLFGAMVRDEHASAWIPVEQSPFAAFLPAAPVIEPAPVPVQSFGRATPQASASESFPTGRWIAIGSAAFGAVAFLVILGAVKSAGPEKEKVSGTTDPVALASANAETERRIAESNAQRAASAASAQAVQDAKLAALKAGPPSTREAMVRDCASRFDQCPPDVSGGLAAATDPKERAKLVLIDASIRAQKVAAMADDGDISTGPVAGLAIMVRDRGAPMLDLMPKTTGGEARKDSDGNRGKVMRASGNVIEIQKSGALFSGAIMTDAGNVVRFVTPNADGVTDSSYVRFRGIFVQEFDYANVSGGQTKSTLLVGLFEK